MPISGTPAWSRVRGNHAETVERVLLWRPPEIVAALAIAEAARDKSRALALAKEYIGREPTALMKTVLDGELPHAEEWIIPLAAAFLAHHKRRLNTRALADKSKEDVAKVSASFRLQGSHRFALDALRRGGDPEQGQAQSREQMLAHFIRAEQAADPAATTEEIRRRTGKAVRDGGGRETVVPPGPKASAKLAVPYEGDEEHELAAFVDRENARQEVEALRRDAARASLSRSERESFGLIVEGHGIPDVARLRCRSETQIRQEKFRALNKIREYRRATGL